MCICCRWAPDSKKDVKKHFFWLCLSFFPLWAAWSMGSSLYLIFCVQLATSTKILFLKLYNIEHKTKSHLTTPSSSVACILGQSIQLKKKFNIRNIFMAMKTLASEKKRSTSISLYKKLFLKACWCSANLRAVAFKPSLFFGIKFSPRFCWNLLQSCKLQQLRESWLTLK